MLCAVTGVIPKDPVVSKTGYLFERSVAVRYIEANGKCPISGDALSVDDLLSIKETKNTKPRVAQATSIPGMLQLFQNEWDSLMLETHTLRQHLETVRQELAQALYQHDAACRVIARLIKERDAARNALATAQAQLAAEGGRSEPMDVEGANIITEELKATITSVSKQLSLERKKRVPPADLTTAAQIQSFSTLSTHPIHKASEPGILCLDIHPTDDNKIVTGGADKTVVIFDRAQGKKLQTLSGHTKKISSVVFHPTANIVFSASHDKTARVWNYGEGSQSRVLKAHTGPVVGITLHPTNEYVATGSSDGSWAFHDINTAKCLAHVRHPESNAGLTSIQLHPDGAILGTGTEDSYFRIWDIRTQQNAVVFGEHTGKITDIAFSENGYFAASAADDGVVKLWDLRKLKSYNSIELGSGHQVTSLAYDYSGVYLAVGGTDIRVFTAKTAEIVHTFEQSGLITDVEFGRNAAFIAATSMDRTLKFIGQK
eukprot:TRINITY_DN12507_c0_g1_i1.p1 TRINITY_DN12507_c0_g1~~TRINITY_DN12507_c0_g1_i1.p1  ORF type:complete len:487 (-),score=104.61 TRINITY_DN12507_c0_g1_i1:54-1514(-)